LEKVKAYEAEIAELKTKVVDVTKLRGEIETSMKAETELSKYRETKIADAKGRIVVALVTGKSKEEIDASVTAAMLAFEDAVAAAGLKTAPGSFAPPTPSTSPTLNLPKEFTQGALAKINVNTPEGRKQYEELRKRLNLR